jgi:hypothetical protein
MILGNYFEMLSSNNSPDLGEEWILTSIEDIEDIIKETGERSDDDEDYELPNPQLLRKSAKISE